MLSPEQKNEIMRLATEASSWANTHLSLDDLKSSLRSSLLNPNAELWDYVTDDQRKKKIVSDLCSKRAELIASENIKLESNVNGCIFCLLSRNKLKVY